MNNKGFTLVEVIVVSVIVGLLATMSVVLYNGYLKESAKNGVTSIAKTAAASASSYWRKTGADPDSAKLKLFLTDPSRFTVTVNGSDSTVVITDTKYSISDTVRFK